MPGSTDEREAMTMNMLDFTMHDEKIIMTRKILHIHQFRDERVRKIVTEHFNKGLETMFTGIFAEMMEKSLLKNIDPEVLAFSYVAPIGSLVQLCDREPERYDEIMEKEMGVFVSRK